jgi:hypothetical protein
MYREDRSLGPIFWILRIGVAMEFIGHGALGLFHLAPAWTSYFAVVGITKDTAVTLMPIVGAFDIAMGILVLVYPVRAVILWMAIWGVWTALLRPMAGESAWEAVERAGNYGTPLALFLLAKGGGWGSWLKVRLTEGLSGARLERYCWLLRLSTVLLLLGHGALNALVRKPVFALQYTMLGFHGAALEPYVGICLSLSWPGSSRPRRFPRWPARRSGSSLSTAEAMRLRSSWRFTSSAARWPRRCPWAARRPEGGESPPLPSCGPSCSPARS